MSNNGKKYTFTRLSKEEKEELLEMARQKMPSRYIAEYIGCSVQTVRNYIKQAGMMQTGVPYKTSHWYWSPGDTELLIQMFNSGVNTYKIADKLNRTREAIIVKIDKLREKLGIEAIPYRNILKKPKYDTKEEPRTICH